MTDALVVCASAVLSVTVGIAASRGLLVYPRLSSLPTLTWPAGLLPLPMAGVAFYGLVPVAGSALLLWRRRAAVPVTVVLLVAATVGPLIPAALIALFTVAATRRDRTTWTLAGLALVPLPLYLVAQPSLTVSALTTAVTGAVLVAASVGWGFFVRGMHRAAEQARVEAAWRTEQVRQREREALAREMHDVLAHRLSLLSVHAGALEVNQNATRAQVAEAAGVIRSSAHQAMEDLQQVLGVLRTPLQPDAAAEPEPPQPTLAELPLLIEQSRKTGMHITLDAPADLRAVPGTSQRTAYRIVQESLTNAHKHAPGQSVRIRLQGAPGEGLTLDVTNPLPPPAERTGPRLPGSGSGLKGLSERTALIGGRLTHGSQGATHRVEAHLPWPA
ncbi:sensor histidine kinase [Streptomyces sp. NPDC001530]|uniref:sensor histidine kinase n=1 Tax=Streptomyces sp. NPDC001530 TaxID=3364582 RepID=UPI003698AE0C